jgi:hypothetical protein
MFPGWTNADSAAAVAEGWAIFERGGDGTLEIQLDDEAAIFANDAEAQLFVADKARAGSDLHQRALTIHNDGLYERTAGDGGWHEEADGTWFRAPVDEMEGTLRITAETAAAACRRVG